MLYVLTCCLGITGAGITILRKMFRFFQEKGSSWNATPNEDSCLSSRLKAHQNNVINIVTLVIKKLLRKQFLGCGPIL
jgi:hypothetical protein